MAQIECKPTIPSAGITLQRLRDQTFELKPFRIGCRLFGCKQLDVGSSAIPIWARHFKYLIINRIRSISECVHGTCDRECYGNW